MDYEEFKESVRELTGYNLHLYKEKQMKRRIETLISRRGFVGYGDFAAELRRNPAELENFKDYVTINVTEFFRTGEHWQYVEETVLPDLIRIFGNKLSVWSCACATGEEAYSLAMSLARYIPTEDIHILATDLDDQVLQTAEAGIYTEKAVEHVSPERLERWFVKQGGLYRVKDELKKCITFRKFDLLQDRFPEQCDLIVCRNVLIYFTEEAKDELFRKFTGSLSKGGCLFTGNTEQIIRYRELGIEKEKTYVYRK